MILWLLCAAVAAAEDSVEGGALLPFVTVPAPPLSPPTAFFPLVYRQTGVSTAFKWGARWYTWATERRTDGSHATLYYVCSEEPQHCDAVGWERTDAAPKCALEITAVSAGRACTRAFGAGPAAHPCDGAQQMKVHDMVRACGPRLHSLWRFVRARPAPGHAPADVNAMLCDGDDECFAAVEYRIHRERITFAVHEPTRGRTYKSVLRRSRSDEAEPSRAPPSGKGVVKERDDSGAVPTNKLRPPDNDFGRPGNRLRYRDDDLDAAPRTKVRPKDYYLDTALRKKARSSDGNFVTEPQSKDRPRNDDLEAAPSDKEDSREDDITGSQNKVIPRDDGFDKPRNKARSRDDDFDKPRNKARLRDVDFVKSRNKARTRDDDFDKPRNKAHTRDDFDKPRNKARSRDDDFGKSRNQARTRDDDFDKPRNKARLRDVDYDKPRHKALPRDDRDSEPGNPRPHDDDSGDVSSADTS